MACKQPAPSAPEALLQPGRLLRVNQIVGTILPISRSHFLAQVKAGAYPQPIKLSARVTCWRSEDILALIEKPEVPHD
jgi:predicted DNA-binding transcriptional regulator AlpA